MDKPKKTDRIAQQKPVPTPPIARVCSNPVARTLNAQRRRKHL